MNMEELQLETIKEVIFLTAAHVAKLAKHGGLTSSGAVYVAGKLDVLESVIKRAALKDDFESWKEKNKWLEM